MLAFPPVADVRHATRIAGIGRSGFRIFKAPQFFASFASSCDSTCGLMDRLSQNRECPGDHPRRIDTYGDLRYVLLAL